MLVAGGPSVMPARVNWPLHAALKELRDEAGRRGLRRMYGSLTFRACPDVAMRADGVDRALFRLTNDGVLQPEGTGRDAVLHVNPASTAELRRRLMHLEPEEAEVLQWAGTRWAALAATSAKNRSSAARSSSSSVASASPNRLQDPPGRDSIATSRRREPRITRLVT